MSGYWQISHRKLYPSLFIIQSLLIVNLTFGCQPLNTSTSYDFSQSSRMTELKNTGKLVIGTAITQPFEYRDPITNALVGFDVDLLTQITTPMGVSLEWHELTFADLIPQLQAGELDVVIAAMYITPVREELIDFSQSYLGTGL